MLKSLPQSYSHIGDLMDVLSEEDRNVDYLKSKIKLKYTVNKNQNIGTEDNNANTSAFTADTRKCYKCGSTGHLQKNCSSTNQRGRGGFNRGRARGHGFQQRGSYRGNYRGAHTSSNQGQQNEQGNAFITEVNASEVKSDNRLRNNEISWILDRGCTDHIINDERLFSEYIVLKEPVDVRLGDGRILKATKIGKVITYFEIFKEMTEL